MSRGMTLGVWLTGMLAVVATSVIILIYPREARELTGMLVASYLTGAFITMSGFILEGIRFKESRRNETSTRNVPGPNPESVPGPPNRSGALADAPTRRFTRRSVDPSRDWVVGTHQHRWSK